MKIDALVTHELQISDHIATAVQHERQSDFAFLLALMSQNAMHMSQFRFEDSLDPPATKLAARLAVSPEPALKQLWSELGAHTPASVFHEGGLAAVRLQEALRPSPIHYDSEPDYHLQAAYNNADPACRLPDEQRLSEVYLNNINLADLIQRQQQLSAT
jgi:hypothetical protein